MFTSLTPEKIKKLYQLICDMVDSQQVPISTVEDFESETWVRFISELSTLYVSLESVFNSLDVDHCSHNEQKHADLVFVLDGTHCIVDYYIDPFLNAKIELKILLGAAFEKTLYPSSLEKWNELFHEFINGTSTSIFSTITLQTKDLQLYPLLCLITRMNNGHVLISSLQFKNLEPLNSVNDNDPFLRDQEQLVQLHAYILEHLDEPLPRLNTLAQMFGIEVHRLKKGFRTYYHTSIYHFYHEQRLLRAQNYILQTNIMLKEVAFLSGFSSYVNFYKSFKKYFGYSPRDLSRPSKD